MKITDLRRVPVIDTTPRLFATEETEYWYDLGLAVKDIGMDDFSLYAETYIPADYGTGTTILYRSSGVRLGLYLNVVTNDLRMLNYTVTGYNERICAFPIITEQWFSWEIRREHGWIKFFLNDEMVSSIDKTGLYLDIDNTDSLSTQTICSLRNCSLRNITRGTTTWLYPSIPEQHNQLRLQNLVTLDGRFRAASGWQPSGASTTRSYIVTDIDLSGSTDNYTVAVDTIIPYYQASIFQQTWHLAGQGNIGSGYAAYQIGLLIIQTGVNQTSLRFRISDGTRQYDTGVDFEPYWDKRIIAVGVLDRHNSLLSLYINGELVSSTVLYNPGPLNPNVTITTANRLFGFYAHPGAYYPNNQEISSILLFEAALSPEEIAEHYRMQICDDAAIETDDLGFSLQDITTIQDQTSSFDQKLSLREAMGTYYQLRTDRGIPHVIKLSDTVNITEGLITIPGDLTLIGDDT